MAYDGVFIRVIRRHFIGSSGKPGMWEVVERKNTHGRIVVIAAVTPERELILQKSFRVPFQNYVIELPAGLMDKEGESEEDTARRELLEETGYAVDDMKLLVSGSFNAGLTTSVIALYQGTNARMVQAQALDDAEDIEVIKVPVTEVLAFMQTQKEYIVDIKITSALPFLEK